MHLNMCECDLNSLCLLLLNALICDSSMQCVILLLFSCNVIQGVVYSLPSRRKSFLKCSTRWRTSLGSLWLTAKSTESLVIWLQFCNLLEFMQCNSHQTVFRWWDFIKNTLKHRSYLVVTDSFGLNSRQLTSNPLFYYTFTTIMTHRPFLINWWAYYESRGV